MKVSRENEVWLCNGGPKQVKFKYCIECSMTNEIADWLQKTFKGYGIDYYYSHGEIWFKQSKHETLFTLVWL